MRYCTLCELFVDGKTHFHEGKPDVVKIIELGSVPRREENNSIEPAYSKKSCTFCGEKKVLEIVKQIRGLDEAPTIFEKCLACSKTLRHD